MSFNKIILVGNLGKDPELRYTPQGTAVCNFSIATNEKKRDNAGDLQDLTTWFRVTLWDKKAEIASKYLTKGSSVYIEGRLKIDEWTDRDGKNRYTLDITATDMQFISGGRGDESYSNSPDSDNSFAGGGPTDNTQEFSGDSSANTPVDDDIPF